MQYPMRVEVFSCLIPELARVVGVSLLNRENNFFDAWVLFPNLVFNDLPKNVAVVGGHLLYADDLGGLATLVGTNGSLSPKGWLVIHIHKLKVALTDDGKHHASLLLFGGLLDLSNGVRVPVGDG